MKVLVISNMYPSESTPSYGVFVENFVTSLHEEGATVDLSVIRGRASSRLKKLAVYFHFFFSTLYKTIFNSYDIVYVHYIAHSIIPLVPALKLKAINLVCNAHGEDLLPRTSLEKIIFNFVKKPISNSKLLVVPSAFFESIARKHFPNLDIFISPSAGIDQTKFRPIPNERVIDNFRIGYVSRIDPGKGWDVLVRAISIVKAKNPNLKLQVELAGYGSEVQELLSLVDELNLNDSIHYVGPLNHKNLPEFYSSLDVFVFPSILAESLGLVGLEALSCGTPAICSDTGGISSYIKHNVNGYLFKPGDHLELSARIQDFISLDKSSICRLKKAASDSVKAYGRNVVSTAMFERLNSIKEHRIL